MPTGYVELFLKCWLCKGRGYFRKMIFHKKDCWRCKGKGELQHFHNYTK